MRYKKGIIEIFYLYILWILFIIFQTVLRLNVDRMPATLVCGFNNNNNNNHAWYGWTKIFGHIMSLGPTYHIVPNKHPGGHEFSIKGVFIRDKIFGTKITKKCEFWCKKSNKVDINAGFWQVKESLATKFTIMIVNHD